MIFTSERGQHGVKKILTEFRQRQAQAFFLLKAAGRLKTSVINLDDENLGKKKFAYTTLHNLYLLSGFFL